MAAYRNICHQSRCNFRSHAQINQASAFYEARWIKEILLKTGINYLPFYIWNIWQRADGGGMPWNTRTGKWNHGMRRNFKKGGAGKYGSFF